MERVVERSNLWSAYQRVVQNKGAPGVRGGLGFSDTGMSGFLPGHDRREVHEKAKT